MKNIFDEPNQQEILQRLEKLTPQSPNQWGKMNPAQMLAHCARPLQLATGELKVKPASFPLNIIGRLLKKSFLGETPFRQNSPTSPEFKVANEVEFRAEKENLKKSFEKISMGGKAAIKTEKHPFFGTMTAEEWARISYKHLDHHFKQFGV